MSTRFAGVVVALASIVGPAVAEELEPFDLEGLLAPRRTGPAPAPARSPSARLVWVDPARAAAGIDGLARNEVGSLLRRMGISVSWRSAVPGELGRAEEVRVILLDRAAANASGELILGSTPSHFEASRFVWVHVPNVRAALGLRPDGPLAALELPSLRALAIALGRVVAHELVHALAPPASHGTGLMSAALTFRQLTAPRLPVDAEAGFALRAALRGEPSLPPAEAGVLATAGREPGIAP